MADVRDAHLCSRSTAAPRRQRGSTLAEFSVVGPLITLLGTTVLQYALMFNAKNVVNPAGFMAAREGSVANSDMASIQQAYARALIPLYGGGQDTESLKRSFLKAQADVLANSRIELLNPTKESFDDWADVSLRDKYQGKRALNHASVQWADARVGATSGQDRRDMRREERADRAALVAALRADPFDPEALDDVAARMQARTLARLDLGQQLIRDHVLAMTPEQRRAFADRLDRHGRRHHDRDKIGD